jgi:MerR family transcriptional regulator, redox-sensitive transcriptional activator SoxR
MSDWAIGEVAKRSGVPPSTIRYYEEMGLLPPPMRVQGRRQYDAAILAQLRAIRRAQSAGLTLAEIQTLIHDCAAGTRPGTHWARLATDKLAALDRQLRDIERQKKLLRQLAECECVTLEECAEKEYAGSGESEAGEDLLHCKA